MAMKPFGGIFDAAAQFTKYVILGAIAIIIIAIFFVGFGGWFIPLLLFAAVLGFAFISGATKTTSFIQILILGFVAFGIGWGMQKMSMYAMTGVTADIPSVSYTGDMRILAGASLVTMAITLFVGVIIIAAVLVPLMKTRWKVR